MQLLPLTVVLCALACAMGDVYMHNPRGSNDRNCERTVNRKNGNRLFNSQNNNNGGYACPRAVGDEEFQPESGRAEFTDVNTLTGSVSTFTQNKRLYYYEGSILPIEWTVQHGCGTNSKATCDMVLQYACEDTLDPKVDDFWPWSTLKAGTGSAMRGRQAFRDYADDNIAAPRDGVPRDSLDAATDTVPDNSESATPNTKETRRFGMQESFNYYETCQHTERNKGLYTADQKVRRNDQRATRQNPNGNRHGFECQEERDYYPWWAPSPWVDIAVLTDSAKDAICYNSDTSNCSERCKWYMDNTMNNNDRGFCDVDYFNATKGHTVADKTNSAAWRNRVWYNNQAACEENDWTWHTAKHSDNLNLPVDNFVCAHTQFARANQLGNGGNADSVVSQNQNGGVVKDDVTRGVNANRFLWTVPSPPTPTATDPDDYFTPSVEAAYQSCVLRIRYNISTADYQAWPEDSVVAGTDPMVDFRNNSRYEGDPRTPLMQDPYVYIGPGDGEDMDPQFVSLAVNTNQYGRTFQDRSYVFSIKPLPTADSEPSPLNDEPRVDWASMSAGLAAGGKIYNVNVRGKRGNIVQTFPSVEYDFVPNALSLNTNDMVHFQWTGSDYNPRRGCNNGEGGPPDANTFNTDANARLNPRADRSNLLFMDSMSMNLPMDYTGYSEESTLSYADKVNAAKATVLTGSPCDDPDATKATRCYEQAMRLAYLNQQRDSGSLVLRAGKACLTQTEIDDIAAINRDTAEHHPLNCAKMNAKPFPYFDGGVMLMRKNGWFPFFSSRNNNFSNREQIGVICVGNSCTLNDDEVLQDQNPAQNGGGARQVSSTCTDTANGEEGANANGVISCLGGSPSDPNAATVDILTVETMATTEGDNDQKGDGNMYGCAVQNNLESTNTITETIDSLTGEQQAGVIVGLLALGIALAWFAYWVYRRYVPENGSARNDQQWLKRNVNRHAGITKYFNNSKQNDWLNGSSGVGGGGGGGGGGGDADDIHLQAEPLKSASQAGSGGGGRGGNSHSPVNIKMNKSARKPPPPPLGQKQGNSRQQKQDDRTAYL